MYYFYSRRGSCATDAGREGELKTTVAQQQKQIEALAATLRKVSERVELGGSAPQVAVNQD